MSRAYSRITYTGIRLPKTFLRTVKKQTEKWICRQQTLLFLPKWASYNVHFEKDDHQYITCFLEVQIGHRFWSSLECGTSNQESFFKALTRLVPRYRKHMEQELQISA